MVYNAIRSIAKIASKTEQRRSRDHGVPHKRYFEGWDKWGANFCLARFWKSSWMVFLLIFSTQRPQNVHPLELEGYRYNQNDRLFWGNAKKKRSQQIKCLANYRENVVPSSHGNAQDLSPLAEAVFVKLSSRGKVSNEREQTGISNVNWDDIFSKVCLVRWDLTCGEHCDLLIRAQQHNEASCLDYFWKPTLYYLWKS